MARVICLFSFTFVNCQTDRFTNIVDSISNYLRSKRNAEAKVPSCPNVNNMPTRCVDIKNLCPRLYQVVNSNRNNPKFVNTLKQLRCGPKDVKNSLVCCPEEWIPKAPLARSNPPLRQISTTLKSPPPKTPLPEETCKSLNAGLLPGRCMSLPECPSLYKQAIERSQDPAVRNEMFRIHCGWVDDDLQRPQVCCPLESIAIPAPTQRSDEPSESDVPSQESEDLVETLPTPPDCGPFNLATPKVVGGLPSKLNFFPWMALLGFRRRSGIEWMCGGSLISTRHVLTAAHCIYRNEKSLFLVRLGELDLARDDDGPTPIDIPIKKKLIHEEYDSEINENDIGIIILATEVQYTDFIKPICMPMREDLRSKSFEKTMPFLAGWGQIKYAGYPATELQFIQIPVSNTAECHEIYKKSNENVKLDNRSLCAGYKQGGRDACPGDSGGPLMHRYTNLETRKTNFYQIGIISYGKSCGAPGYPGIYVRVSEYITWIVKQTTGKNVS